MNYDFKSAEKKWQERWEREGVFNAVDGSDKPKFYTEPGAVAFIEGKTVIKELYVKGRLVNIVVK